MQLVVIFFPPATRSGVRINKLAEGKIGKMGKSDIARKDGGTIVCGGV